jgi:hypothetical protein
MTALRYRRTLVLAAVLVLTMSGGRADAQQSALTTLPEEPPADVLYRLGPVLVNPKLTIPEIGRDSNAFNDSTAPQSDFVVKLTPEVELFSDIGPLRAVVTSAATFTYYHRFESERSIAEQVRGRLTARLSRLRPWVGGASIRSNERTTEIDARARRDEREGAAGMQFELSPLATLSVSANRVDVAYSDRAQYLGTTLRAELDRVTDTVSASLRLNATPFTTITLNGYTSRDEFDVATDRDSTSRGGGVEVNFAPEAVIRGRVAIGFRQQDFADPTLATFRGINGRGSITTVFAWRAMLGVDYLREVQYSFDRREGYYVENGGDVVYTQRIGGPFDAQARIGRRVLDYAARPSSPSHSETVRMYQGGVGYSLDGGSRFGINYEFAERVGAVAHERTFSRQRIFGTFTYEFWK